MVASPAPSTRLARAVSQRRQQRKERSPVKQQHEKTTISTATGTDGSKPSNWWIQGGIVSNSTDEMTVSSQSAVSYVSNGTGTSSNRSAAANRRRLRIAQQKDALPTDRAPELRVSVGSDSVPKTVLTPRATNSLSRSIFSLAQKRVSGSDVSSNASAAVSSPTPLTPSAQNSRLASNRFLKLTEERDKFQKDATLLKQQARSATEAKNVAEKEKNEAINFMEHQIESLQETLKAITEQMGMVQINEQALHEKQLNDSKSNVAVLQKRLQQMAVVNEGLVEKVREATKNEQAMADMKRTIARTKSEHASVVESLRKDLAAAKQILDDKQSSFKSDVEAVKLNHAKEVSFYKEEIEGFRAQLKTAMKNADRSDVKDIERELAESRNENRELVKQLKQAQDAANRLKANSEKDVQLLESELDKTHKTKVDVELELKETKRQLSSALQNLDEMTEDGEHMQIKVEGMMAGFAKEKENFQNEITILKRDREEKLALMDELRREKIAVDIDSKNLQQNVRDLEMKLRGAEKFISDLENEVQSLKSKKEQNAPEHAITEIVNVNQLRDDKASLQNQLDSKEKSMINLRQTNRDLSMKLSKAQQTIHKLQSKEKYLESRVESLSNQISQTVHDYEIKLANC
eukprot:scaffold3103_cov132-Skeletonema_menzelii.AAC.4